MSATRAASTAGESRRACRGGVVRQRRCRAVAAGPARGSAAIGDRRVCVTDRRDDVALRCEIFSEPAECDRVVVVTVRDDDERKAADRGNSIAHGDSRPGEFRRRGRRLRGETARVRYRGRVCGHGRGIPEFDGERAAAPRRNAARGIDREDINRALIDEGDRAVTDAVRAESRELRRIDAGAARRVVGPGRRRNGHSEREKGGWSASHRHHPRWRDSPDRPAGSMTPETPPGS